jgi:hypothetical protein
MANVKMIATAIVFALVGVLVGYLLFNSLFSPTNTAVETLCTTMTASGYTTEADLAEQAWSFYLLAIPLMLLGGSVAMIVKAFK